MELVQYGFLERDWETASGSIGSLLLEIRPLPGPVETVERGIVGREGKGKIRFHYHFQGAKLGESGSAPFSYSPESADTAEDNAIEVGNKD